VIDAYVDALLGALRHDRSLARRVRREVEDHLWEAVAADPSVEDREALLNWLPFLWRSRLDGRVLPSFLLSLVSTSP
jgi:hypothetical protein